MIHRRVAAALAGIPGLGPDAQAGSVFVERRRLLGSALGLAALGAAGSAWPARAFAQRAGAPAGGRERPEPAPGARLVVLGTRGGPGVDLAHAQTACALVVDGTPYLVDCGYGTLRALVAANVPYLDIDTVFFTHLHNDHTSDFAAFLSHQWTSSKMRPTEVYGPYGTMGLVAGAAAFARADVEIRVADEGRKSNFEELFRGHEVPATAEPTRVFADERVVVTAAENTHYPERAKALMQHRSLSYRFDTRERSLVFAGDTAYSKNLVGLARGADVFICEVMAQSVKDLNDKRAADAAAAGNPNSIFRHIAETHSTPSDVGLMAKEADVKTVVLNHQLPGARTGGLDFAISAFIDGVRATFPGEVVVGRDLMVL